MLDLYPGGPQFSEVAGWKLLVELGWPARLWVVARVQAVMLAERAALAEWPLLHAVLERSSLIRGAWMYAVEELRAGYGLPQFDRAAARRAPSRAARRARLRQYRTEVVEPRMFEDTEAEIRAERQKPAHALYNRLHPGRGPVAGVLQGNEWGPETLGDYKRWVRLRILLRCPSGCPACTSVDGTAEHILRAHAAPKVWQGEELDRADPFRLLRTDTPTAELRRNIRVVGQVLRGGQDWKWLGAAPPPHP